MRIDFTPHSYSVILRALVAYQASLEAGHKDEAKVEQLIESIRTIIKVSA